ncbi:hypothetical protein ABIC71_001940, partial [Herbaspirillum seropedicae]
LAKKSKQKKATPKIQPSFGGSPPQWRKKWEK